MIKFSGDGMPGGGGRQLYTEADPAGLTAQCDRYISGWAAAEHADWRPCSNAGSKPDSFAVQSEPKKHTHAGMMCYQCQAALKEQIMVTCFVCNMCSACTTKRISFAAKRATGSLIRARFAQPTDDPRQTARVS